MMAHVDAPPPSPLERRPDLPRQFDDVVRRAMAKHPGERYQSAGDLGEAALVAAGGLRRAGSESVDRHRRRTAGGAPARAAGGRAPAEPAAARPPVARTRRRAGGRGPLGLRRALRWVLPLAVLVILALGMVLALGALSKL